MRNTVPKEKKGHHSSWAESTHLGLLGPCIMPPSWLSQPSSPFYLRMKLPCVTLGALLLLLPAGHGGTETSAIDLRTFIGCAVREFTFVAKKPGCKALRITTDACWGRCETWEVRVFPWEKSIEQWDSQGPRAALRSHCSALLQLVPSLLALSQRGWTSCDDINEVLT